MTPKKNFILILVSLVIGLVLLSIFCTKMIEKEAVVKTGVITAKQEAVVTPGTYSLKVSRPEDYGMIVVNPSTAPKAQADWNTLVRDKINSIKSDFSKEVRMSAWKKIEEDPIKTQGKIKLIDENIKKCHQLLLQDPNNEEIKVKLEHLMMLKSLSTELVGLKN